MTKTTIHNATELLYEIASLPEPERTEYIKMMRHVLMGLRLSELAQAANPQQTGERPVA